MPHNLKSAFTRLLPPIKVESAIIARNRLFGPAMDANRFVFVIEIPPKFEQDVIANRRPSVQINADATGIAQAGNGVAYLQQIIAQQVLSFARHAGGTSSLPVNFMEH